MTTTFDLTEKIYSAIKKVEEKTSEFVRSFHSGQSLSIKYENMAFSYGLLRTIKRTIKKLDLNTEEKESVLQYMKGYYSYSLI